MNLSSMRGCTFQAKEAKVAEILEWFEKYRKEL